MLTSKRLLSIAIIVLAWAAAPASRAEVLIVANPAVAVSEVSRDDLARIFLMTKTSLQGAGRVEPVLKKSGPAHEAFLKKYIGRSDFALMTYYRGLLFSGRGSLPKTFSSDDELVAYISRTKGAIGYVRPSSVNSSVKVLKVK